jgi:hypothetical protein
MLTKKQENLRVSARHGNTQVRPCKNICMLILLEYMTPSFTLKPTHAMCDR